MTSGASREGAGMGQSCIDIIVDYAREQALLPPPSEYAGPEWQQRWAQARWCAARAWLWLPVLWQIRNGQANTEWRQEIQAAAQTAATTSPEIATVVMELSEIPPQPWDPHAHRWPATTPATAADAWYQTVSVILFDMVFHVQSAVAQHRVDPANRWHTEVVPAACQMAAAVLIASWRVARDPAATESATLGFTAADRSITEAPPPWYWHYKPLPPDVGRIKAIREQCRPTRALGVDPRIAAVITEQTTRSEARLADLQRDTAELRRDP